MNKPNFIIDCREVKASKEPLLTRAGGSPFNLDWHYIEYPFNDTFWVTLPRTKLPIITFQEFKNMKEIRGYNLKPEFKDCIPALKALGINIDYEKDSPQLYAHSWIDRARELAILDLWFEPEYKEGFKRGDYVKILDTSNIRFYNSEAIGKIVRLTNEEDGLGSNIDSLNYSNSYILANNKYHINFKKSDFKLLTEEEIKEYNNVTIGDHQALYDKNHVSFGCQLFFKEELLQYRRLLDQPINGKISIHDTKITIEILDKLLNNLES